MSDRDESSYFFFVPQAEQIVAKLMMNMAAVDRRLAEEASRQNLVSYMYRLKSVWLESQWMARKIWIWIVSHVIIKLAQWASKMNQILRCDWLPEHKMELSCQLGTTCRVPQEKFPQKPRTVINPLLTKLVRSRWLDIGLVLFFASLWTSTASRSINMQKSQWVNNPFLFTLVSNNSVISVGGWFPVLNTLHDFYD